MDATVRKQLDSATREKIINIDRSTKNLENLSGQIATKSVHEISVALEKVKDAKSKKINYLDALDLEATIYCAEVCRDLLALNQLEDRGMLHPVEEQLYGAQAKLDRQIQSRCQPQRSGGHVEHALQRWQALNTK